MEAAKNIDQFYIWVEGKWNTVLVKTPTDSALGGRFADKYKLLLFYGKETILETSIGIDTGLTK